MDEEIAHVVDTTEVQMLVIFCFIFSDAQFHYKLFINRYTSIGNLAKTRLFKCTPPVQPMHNIALLIENHGKSKFAYNPVAMENTANSLGSHVYCHEFTP